jgi:hypothetical protein
MYIERLTLLSAAPTQIQVSFRNNIETCLLLCCGCPWQKKVSLANTWDTVLQSLSGLPSTISLHECLPILESTVRMLEVESSSLDPHYLEEEQLIALVAAP